MYTTGQFPYYRDPFVTFNQCVT